MTCRSQECGCNLQLSSQSCSALHRKNLRLIRAENDSTNNVMTLNNLMLKALAWGKQVPSFYPISKLNTLFIESPCIKFLKTTSG